jgi:hypothetical protein
VSPRVVRDDAVFLGERAKLRPEVAGAAAEAVTENDRTTDPFGFDVK